MANLFFGPCTVTYNGSDIGKTYGGVKLAVDRIVDERQALDGSTVRREVIKKVKGSLNMYETEPLSVVDSLARSSTAATLVLLGDTFRVTVRNCYLDWPENMDFGQMQQSPFVVTLYAYPDGSTTILQVEDV